MRAASGRGGALRAALAALCLAGLGAAGQARADSCSATLSNLSFSAVSPISVTDYFTTGTGSVSCTWNLLSATPPFLLLFPNVVVCVYAGLGSNSLSSNPRTMGNGANRLEYNLYRNATYTPAAIWGQPSLAATPTPFTMTLTSPSLIVGGTIAQAFTVYGKISAGTTLAAVPTVANSNTSYLSSFTGNASISYAFYNLIAPACTAGGSAVFTFQADATVINNCTISAAPLAFGTKGVLSSVSRSTANLSVQCVNNNAYQIALNGGSVALNVANRQMKNIVGVEQVAYRLSASLDGPLWGDGSAGTSVYAGTGNGAAQTVTVYGMVPVQGTPAPGDYKDTVTATIYF